MGDGGGRIGTGVACLCISVAWIIVPPIVCNLTFFKCVISSWQFLRLCSVPDWWMNKYRIWREKNQRDATIRCLLLTSISTCFGHHYGHLQEIKEPVTAFGVLFWFYWMWLVAVLGCEHYVLTSYKTASQNRYQPHPVEPEQYTKCSNGFFDLLKMGIMMPKTCWDRS